MKLFCGFALFFLFLPIVAGATESHGRFFYEGDGTLSLQSKHNGKTLTVRYRNEDGTYSRTALTQINQLFGMPAAELGEDISLRLISLLDFLQDRFCPGKTLILVSGYRSPALNAKLRKMGRLAAETSYHMQGMAADVEFPGADAHKIWEYVRSLDYGGVGYYHSSSLHIDAGQPRFWTEATALPKTKEPPENRHIYLSVDQDIYHPGETVRLFLSGISDYPFGVQKEITLGHGQKLDIQFNESPTTTCVPVQTRKDARFITWTIPADFPSSTSRQLSINMDFCDVKAYPHMPSSAESRPFEIK